MGKWKNRTKNVIDAILRAWIKLPLAVMNRVAPKYAGLYFVKAVGESVEKVLPYFVSFNFRPKLASDFLSREVKSPHAGEFAIIMQGPLVLKDHFTLETVRLYGKLFPGVSVIISTWDTEDQDYVSILKMEPNCEVILNPMPCHSGFMNGNYQMCSTVAGIKRAKEMGKTFVFKTRCDYRFTKRGLLEYMRQLLMDYPCGCTLTKQKYRIVMTSGRHDDMFRPFYVGDQFNFGFIDDMLNFWDHPMAEVDCTLDDFDKIRKREHYSWKKEREYCSILTKRFVKKMSGEELEISVENYWNFARDYLIFLSAKDADAFWCKYDERFEENMYVGEYYRNDSLDTCYAYNWNFSSWCNLYHGTLKYDPDMEQISEKNTY